MKHELSPQLLPTPTPPGETILVTTQHSQRASAGKWPAVLLQIRFIKNGYCKLKKNKKHLLYLHTFVLLPLIPLTFRNITGMLACQERGG